MSLTTTDLEQLRGKQVVGPDGDKIGKVDEFYLDEQTGQPEWMSVSTGMFGSNVSFVPLADAQADADGVRVRWDKDKVKEAPNVDPSQQLTQDEEAQLYRHYGMDYGGSQPDAGLPDPNPVAGDAAGPGHDTSGPSTDSAMTRSEEELKVGTVKQESGRVRLRKYVVTENVTTTVPVQREEVRLEREPITEANAGQALDGPAISEEEHEVVLHEEKPVVQKEVVPKERVRLDTETRTEEAQVSEEVRKEQVDVDDGTRR